MGLSERGMMSQELSLLLQWTFLQVVKGVTNVVARATTIIARCNHMQCALNEWALGKQQAACNCMCVM